MTCSPAFSRSLGDFITSTPSFRFPVRAFGTPRDATLLIFRSVSAAITDVSVWRTTGSEPIRADPYHHITSRDSYGVHRYPKAIEISALPQEREQEAERRALCRPQAVLLAPDRSAIMALIEDRRRTFIDHEQSGCPLPRYARKLPLEDHSLHGMQANGRPTLIPSLERLDCWLATC